MASMKVYGMDGAEVRTVEVSDAVFDAVVNESLVRETVVALQASRHRGTHKTKVRHEVRGGGAKPFRQKGTGRARQGSSREPHMRGGGTIFGPQPRSYRQSVPTRVRRQAMCCALSERLRADRIGVVAGLQIDVPKTKTFNAMLQRVSPEGRKTLFITAASDENVMRSSRNIQRVAISTASDVNVLDILGARRILIQEEALATLEERLT